MDFDDLIMRTVDVLQLFPERLAHYRRAFRHVLVDEFQDTNHAQYVLVQLLGKEHQQVTVVGDDDQSVYSWRGADVRNILEFFEQDFPGATVVKLEQNYRSTTTILEAANAVVAHNRGRKPKHLWTDRGQGEPVVLLECRDEHEEARLVAGRDRGAAAGGPPGDRRRRLLPGERPVAGARGHPGALRGALPGGRRDALLRAGRDQGHAGLPAGAREPRRRPRLPAHRQRAQTGAGRRGPGTAAALRRRRGRVAA